VGKGDCRQPFLLLITFAFAPQSIALPQKLSMSAAQVRGHADLTVNNIHRPFIQKRPK
jgi:hypothetical protein